ncbi:ATP-binding cassette domain-containing protein [Microbacterium sp. TNHR37B]|uniref:ATP-binding cassette domain-containing protein n=1 Tax=Microbacterium sp. TNHR37B TaxID=1775956 RepID=UPI0007B1C692|nr:ATP-binding cassette domain-containing protein [Microbacterium sp. TNHR37B]KZE88756.1 putative HMP/thiamine import ATP-binding protein YkoD [Microbacterium sp. TNHR37B]
MTVRPAPLRAAAALAAGFVVVRVVYRVLFHGADGAGTLLLDLPVLRLAPPFGHVEILGPVTSGGLATAALSALPIAGVILAFGVLNALVDVPRLLARGAQRGPLQGFARALAVAWATLPALAAAARAVATAQRLRGDRAGIRILAPVLEHTLERATALGAALELRGYAGRPLEGDCARPVELASMRAGFTGPAVVRVDALAASPGELIVVSGATGSGKSTLLRTLSGLHTHVDGGVAGGRIVVAGHDRLATAPRHMARLVGAVLQQPRTSFAADRVDDEVGLALELRGVAPVLRRARVDEVLRRVGISALGSRRTSELSAGEATLVAIAAAIVEEPVLLVVDEPLADLDRSARERIVSLLGALAHEAGVCVIVAEHRTDEFRAVADRSLHVTEDGAVVDGPLPRTLERAPEFRAGRPGQPSPAREAETVLDVRGVSVRRGRRTVVDDVSLRLAAGELTAVSGPNGAGKSTLLRTLSREPGTALVPDDSDDLFVRATVRAELRREDARAKTPGVSVSRFAALLGLDPTDPRLEARLGRHPRDLSVGERRCLAIVLQTARTPRVLLVDEPTRGLDPSARRLVMHALAAQADAGTAVLLASHDTGFCAALADRLLAMRGGTLERVDGPTPQPAAASPVAPGESRPRVAPPAPDAAPSAVADSGGTDSPRAGGRLPRGATAGNHARPVLLIAANLLAAASFLWPLVVAALPPDASSAVPVIALAAAPLAVLLVLAALDGSVRSAHTLSLLAVLAAVGAAIRIASTGVGGVEALFILLILAGRVCGARFGLLLGAASIGLSAALWGGVGPWLPFQMFACGWVGAGAALLPRRPRGAAEIAMLAAYGVVASYLFGLVMNMWFWPFAVGGDTSISYVPGGGLGENLGNFLVYSLVTSTATWDTLRAVTTVVGILLVGRAVLSSLRRTTAAASPARLPARGPGPASPSEGVSRTAAPR